MAHDLDPASGTSSVVADFQGSNQSGMRERNERLVLSLVRRAGALPKAEIARRTGLSAQTASVIMRRLEGEGLLARGEKVRGKVGQPSVPMGLAPGGAFFFGLKVGRRSVELLLVDFLGQVRHRAYDTYNYPTPDGTMAFIKASVAELRARLSPSERARISGLGIAMPFFLWEWATQIGVDEAEMAAWKVFDLRAEVERLFDFPVYLENDATSACGAELVFGDGAAPSDFLYFYMGYFIGGGLVLNGQLYTGPSGNAGAIGPLPAIGTRRGERQLVDVASLAGLEKRFYAAGGTHAGMWGTPGAWDVPESIVAAWIADVAPEIAHAVHNAIAIIDVSAVLIDGSMPDAVRTVLVAAVNAELDQSRLSGLVRPAILEGSVGPDARSLGAASLPLSKRFMLEA